MKSKLTAIVIGTGAAAIALLFSLFALGPLARLVFGAPLDFGSDNTSVQSQHQALGVEIVGFSMTFFLVGIICARQASNFLPRALWIANPISVGLGFLIVRTLNRELLSEYIGLLNCLTLPLLSMLVLAPLALLGAYVRRRYS